MKEKRNTNMTLLSIFVVSLELADFRHILGSDLLYVCATTSITVDFDLVLSGEKHECLCRRWWIIDLSLKEGRKILRNTQNRTCYSLARVSGQFADQNPYPSSNHFQKLVPIEQDQRGSSVRSNNKSSQTSGQS